MSLIKTPEEDIFEQKVEEAAEKIAIREEAEKLVASESSFTEEEMVPSDWQIAPGDHTEIRAYNTVTRRVFEGTVADFNALMR